MSDESFDIQAELKKLPQSPGVYIMHGTNDEIIYVGKAVNLKNRVRQYFQSPKGKSPKILKMISLIRRFEYIVVDSETEALVLENNLIKEHSPRYNTLLKDDKTYPYIKVTVGEEFPRVIMTRKVKRDKARYFGPYTNAAAVRQTIILLRKLFRIRSCSRNLPQDIGRERPCLYHHISECFGPCAGYIEGSEYRRHVARAVDFLSGKYEPVRKYLTDRMNRASESCDFEKAIEYRDLLKNIDDLAESQKVTLSDMSDRDIIGISPLGNKAAVTMFFMRKGRMIGRDNFHLDIDPEEETGDMIYAFVGQYYGGTPYIPSEIWIQDEIHDRRLIEEWLTQKSGHAVHVQVPKKGEKEKLVELAVRNAGNLMANDLDRLKKEDERTRGAAESLRKLLGLESLKRIESYDISNTNGFESVGSMVVFTEGKPRSSDYRKFRIKEVKGPDDYASMREMLMRRFVRAKKPGASDERDSFSILPDLIMMDGGKGQVNTALRVLSELCLDIPVCGMVKDDHHRTRGIYFNNTELSIDVYSQEFRLITRIQDETHRFAIEYHRSLRTKEQSRSVLDDIPGIGPKRRRALMMHFRDIGSIRSADVEQLMEPEGMNRAAAEAVYSFFHESN